MKQRFSFELADTTVIDISSDRQQVNMRVHRPNEGVLAITMTDTEAALVARAMRMAKHPNRGE